MTKYTNTTVVAEQFVRRYQRCTSLTEVTKGTIEIGKRPVKVVYVPCNQPSSHVVLRPTEHVPIL